jgi:hypothetical protein
MFAIPVNTHFLGIATIFWDEIGTKTRQDGNGNEFNYLETLVALPGIEPGFED